MWAFYGFDFAFLFNKGACQINFIKLNKLLLVFAQGNLFYLFFDKSKKILDQCNRQVISMVREKY